MGLFVRQRFCWSPTGESEGIRTPGPSLLSHRPGFCVVNPPATVTHVTQQHKIDDGLPPLPSPEATDAERGEAIMARLVARIGSPSLEGYRRAYVGCGAPWPGDDEIRRAVNPGIASRSGPGRPRRLTCKPGCDEIAEAPYVGGSPMRARFSCAIRTAPPRPGQVPSRIARALSRACSTMMAALRTSDWFWTIHSRASCSRTSWIVRRRPLVF